METSTPIPLSRSTVSDELCTSRLKTNIRKAPSYSMLRMEEHPTIGGDTAWVSQYGLYDALSDAMKDSYTACTQLILLVSNVRVLLHHSAQS